MISRIRCCRRCWIVLRRSRPKSGKSSPGCPGDGRIGYLSPCLCPARNGNSLIRCFYKKQKNIICLNASWHVGCDGINSVCYSANINNCRRSRLSLWRAKPAKTKKQNTRDNPENNKKYREFFCRLFHDHSYDYTASHKTKPPRLTRWFCFIVSPCFVIHLPVAPEAARILFRPE